MRVRCDSGSGDGHPRGAIRHKPSLPLPRAEAPVHCICGSSRSRSQSLEREQFDRLNKARVESFTKVFGARQRFDQITKQYTELQKTLQGKDRFDLDVKYFETEMQSLRGDLEVKSYQIAQELAPRQRRLEDEESSARTIRTSKFSTGRSTSPARGWLRRR